MLDFSSDNSFETTAYALKALANLDPKSDLLPRAARWLMEHRSDGYYWDSTEQTATAIYGLIDYLKISGELKPNYTLSVYLNGQKLADRNITEKDVANPLPIVLTAAAPQVHAGANEVRIVKSGAGVLYWSASASYFSREPKPPPAGSYALNVVREYFKLVPERQDNRIVYSEQPLTGQQYVAMCCVVASYSFQVTYCSPCDITPDCTPTTSPAAFSQGPPDIPGEPWRRCAAPR